MSKKYETSILWQHQILHAPSFMAARVDFKRFSRWLDWTALLVYTA
jgi:hypothetical protein